MGNGAEHPRVTVALSRSWEAETEPLHDTVIGGRTPMAPPQTLRVAEENLKLPRKVSRFKYTNDKPRA